MPDVTRILEAVLAGQLIEGMLMADHRASEVLNVHESLDALERQDPLGQRSRPGHRMADEVSGRWVQKKNDTDLLILRERREFIDLANSLAEDGNVGASPSN